MSKKTIIIAVIILLVVVLIWLIARQPAPIVEEPVIEEPEAVEESPEIKIVDCGHAGPGVSEEEANVVGNCIKEKFKECKPAKATMTIDLGPLGVGEITYYYEIVGPSDNLCAVKSKFLENPNPDWIGKEMICKYDNSKDFDTAVQDSIVQDFSGCSGPLYNLMTEGMQLHSDPNCTLKSSPIEVGLGLPRGIVSASVIALDFKGTENQVTWRIVDTNIATVSPLSGKKVKVKPVNVGSTQLIITDTAVDSDCFVSIPVIIESSF